MRTVAGVALLVALAVGRSAAQTAQVDPQLRAAAALQATVDAASPPLSPVPGFWLALPATHKQHALATTLLIIGAGAIVVGAAAGGGGGTVLIVGGVACAAYGVYLLQL